MLVLRIWRYSKDDVLSKKEGIINSTMRRGSAFWCKRDVIDSNVPVWTDSAVLAFKRHLSIKQEWKQRSYFR